MMSAAGESWTGSPLRKRRTDGNRPMWCKQCQSEVAAELSPERQTLRCTNCGSTLQQIVVPSLHPETQAARELLERWEREQQSRSEISAGGREQLGAVVADPKSPFSPAKDADSGFSNDQGTTDQSPRDPSRTPASPITQRKIRVDGRHTAPEGPNQSPHRTARRRPLLPTEAVAESTPSPQAHSAIGGEPSSVEHASVGTASRHRIDAGHPGGAGPHFAVPSSAPSALPVPGRSESLWGQILAYAGVGVLTFGAVLVLWGYFGGIEAYTSTGWLLSTAGQMLLLLGVVTLVAGGMQQTTHEVGQRIDHLGGRIIRIEHSTKRILKGPNSRRSRHGNGSAVESGQAGEEAA